MPEDREYRVDMLACPACGGQIGGSGNCGHCGQLNIVTKNHKLLSIQDEDVEGINLKRPSKEAREKSDNPNWQVGGWNWSEDSLIVLSNSEPEYGAKMVALYLKKHPEKDLPGCWKPDMEEIGTFVLSTAIKQSLRK